MKVLNLPKETVSFALSAKVNGPVEVTCVFYPEQPTTTEKATLHTAKYRLVLEEITEEKQEEE
jgi:hypothetical protein